MDKAWFKKFKIRFEISCKYVPSYVYAYEQGFKYPYQFFFYPWQNRKMWRMVRSLRSRGFRVHIWRPQNHWTGLK